MHDHEIGSALDEPALTYSILSSDGLTTEDGLSGAVEKSGEAGVLTSIVNLSAAILGAGMISLAYGFSKSGFTGGLIMLILSALASAFTMHLLAVVSHKIAPGRATFYLIAQQTITRGMWIFEAIIIINTLGLATSYLVVFGETMPYVFGSRPNQDFGTNSRLWVTIALILVTPISFAPTFDMLRFTSGGGMACTFYLAAIVWYYYTQPEGRSCRSDSDDFLDLNATIAVPSPSPTESSSHCGGEFKSFLHNIGILEMLSICIFAFTAHVQLIPVVNEVKDYTEQKMKVIIFGAVGLCTVLYIIVGVLGYATFGDTVKGNILESYPNDTVIGIARVAISLLVAVSYPLMCKPARDSALSLLRNTGSQFCRDISNTYHAYIFITLLFLLTSYSIAMLVINYEDALEKILAVIGSTCSTAVAFILPGLAYAANADPSKPLKKKMALAMVISGCIISPLCLWATFFVD